MPLSGIKEQKRKGGEDSQAEKHLRGKKTEATMGGLWGVFSQKKRKVF